MGFGGSCAFVFGLFSVCWVVFFFNSLVGVGGVNLQVSKNLEFCKGLTTEIMRQSKEGTCFELIV